MQSTAKRKKLRLAKSKRDEAEKDAERSLYTSLTIPESPPDHQDSTTGAGNVDQDCLHRESVTEVPDSDHRDDAVEPFTLPPHPPGKWMFQSCPAASIGDRLAGIHGYPLSSPVRRACPSCSTAEVIFPKPYRRPHSGRVVVPPPPPAADTFRKASSSGTTTAPPACHGVQSLLLDARPLLASFACQTAPSTAAAACVPHPGDITITERAVHSAADARHRNRINSEFQRVLATAAKPSFQGMKGTHKIAKGSALGSGSSAFVNALSLLDQELADLSSTAPVSTDMSASMSMPRAAEIVCAASIDLLERMRVTAETISAAPDHHRVECPTERPVLPKGTKRKAESPNPAHHVAKLPAAQHSEGVARREQVEKSKPLSNHPGQTVTPASPANSDGGQSRYAISSSRLTTGEAPRVSVPVRVPTTTDHPSSTRTNPTPVPNRPSQPVTNKLSSNSTDDTLVAGDTSAPAVAAYWVPKRVNQPIPSNPSGQQVHKSMHESGARPQQTRAMPVFKYGAASRTPIDQHRTEGDSLPTTGHSRSTAGTVDSALSTASGSLSTTATTKSAMDAKQPYRQSGSSTFQPKTTISSQPTASSNRTDSYRPAAWTSAILTSDSAATAARRAHAPAMATFSMETDFDGDDGLDDEAMLLATAAAEDDAVAVYDDHVTTVVPTSRTPAVGSSNDRGRSTSSASGAYHCGEASAVGFSHHNTSQRYPLANSSKPAAVQGTSSSTTRSPAIAKPVRSEKPLDSHAIGVAGRATPSSSRMHGGLSATGSQPPPSLTASQPRFLIKTGAPTSAGASMSAPALPKRSPSQSNGDLPASHRHQCQPSHQREAMAGVGRGKSTPRQNLPTMPRSRSTGHTSTTRVLISSCPMCTKTFNQGQTERQRNEHIAECCGDMDDPF